MPETDYACFDGDDDVDLDGFVKWYHCMGGPNALSRTAGCGPLDCDYDGDIDLGDFTLFTQWFGSSS